MAERGIYDVLLDEGLSPETVEQLIALGELQTEEGLLERQQTYADQLRQSPEARGRWSGRVYRAANPMEHMATAANRVIGGYMNQQAAEQMRGIADQRSAARAKLLRAMSRRPAMPAPGMGAPPESAAAMLGPPQPATTMPIRPMAPRPRMTPYVG